jgi:hypothetical protein
VNWLKFRRLVFKPTARSKLSAGLFSNIENKFAARRPRSTRASPAWTSLKLDPGGARPQYDMRHTSHRRLFAKYETADTGGCRKTRQ